MNRFLTFLLLIIGTSLYAQTAHITNSLSKELNETNGFVKVNLVLKDQVNYSVLKNQFNQNDYSLDQRAKVVMRESMTLSQQTQLAIIQHINNNPKQVANFKSFWIINMMTIEAHPDFILELANWPEVDYIELHDHYVGKPIEIMKGGGNAKSINGIEPGLAAINAPALWAMGYTGKNRKYYSIDTGVWPRHPAIDEQFLGHYVPIDQAWNAIDSPTPTDKDGSHGTHTTGTVLGLDEDNNDTIGVAFNAYHMAADPIVTNVNDIKPLPEYIDVFQFALNPDGDTSTTNDIPDAINNSWGIDEHKDTSICAGYVTQMFDAIEAAGIANVFSAGNEGSADTTIGKPQYVSTGLVNTFTVGAVNGNTPTFPITGFSSRGPTACPATGSIAIKPEVVAPGYQVRSAVGEDNFAMYNGTSMAGPHATGACLLLKEAFPNVPGEDILLALYYSATDLGVAGEDNTYGMGMIDVLAAYNYLAQTHTPVSPSSYKYDLSISEIRNPNGNIVCNKMIDPVIVLKNNGDSTINQSTITYQLNDEPISSFTWNGTLNSGDTTSVALPSITAQNFGAYEFRIHAGIDTNKVECDDINNQRMSRFNIQETISSLPFHETFETVKLDSSRWYINNHDGGITWDTAATSGLLWSNYSAYIPLYQYDPRRDQIDGLYTPNITLPNQDSVYLKFDLSYQMIHTILADTMMISISTDCGETFTEIYKKGGLNLETFDTNYTDFVPLYAHHWRTEYIDITSFANNDVIIKFESKNNSGNNLYLDNIWVYEGEEPQGIENLSEEIFQLFPNPATNEITIKSDRNLGRIEVFDMMGKKLHDIMEIQSQTRIDISQFPNGVYLLNRTHDNGTSIHKFIKQ